MTRVVVKTGKHVFPKSKYVGGLYGNCEIKAWAFGIVGSWQFPFLIYARFILLLFWLLEYYIQNCIFFYDIIFASWSCWFILQTLIYFYDPIELEQDQLIEGLVTLSQSRENARFMNIHLEYTWVGTILFP